MYKILSLLTTQVKVLRQKAGDSEILESVYTVGGFAFPKSLSAYSLYI